MPGRTFSRELLEVVRHLASGRNAQRKSAVSIIPCSIAGARSMRHGEAAHAEGTKRIWSADRRAGGFYGQLALENAIPKALQTVPGCGATRHADAGAPRLSAAVSLRRLCALLP